MRPCSDPAEAPGIRFGEACARSYSSQTAPPLRVFFLQSRRPPADNEKRFVETFGLSGSTKVSDLGRARPNAMEGRRNACVDA